MDDTHKTKAGWKQKFVSELIDYWIVVVYLACFFGVFTWHRNRRGRMLPACRTAGDKFAIPTFELTPRDVAGFTDALQEFQGLFHDCFPRSEPRAHFFDYR